MIDLQVEKLSARYNVRRKVLHDVNFSLSCGTAMLISGQNGSGKSTLLRVLAGLLPFETGDVLWQGTKVKVNPFGAPVYPWSGIMLQADSIFPSLTVEENVALAKDMGRGRIFEDYVDVLAALKPFWRKRAGLLSGGERKLLGFALVMAMNAPLLLLDEPIAGLSFENTKKVMDVLARRKADGAVIIIVEHSAEALQNGLIDIRSEMIEGVLTLETSRYIRER